MELVKGTCTHEDNERKRDRVASAKCAAPRTEREIAVEMLYYMFSEVCSLRRKYLGREDAQQWI